MVMPDEKWLKGNAFGEVTQGEWPTAKGKVRRTDYIAPRLLIICLQLSAYRLQSNSVIV